MDYLTDPGVRTNSGAVLLTPWSARGMSNDAFSAQQAKDAHAAAVSAAVARAEQTPKLSAAAGSQDFIKSEIQGLEKRLQVLQKLFAGNPKGMAQALTQIFKELRAALKEYKAATGQDFAGADAAATQVTAPAPASSDTATASDPAAKAATASYAEVDQALREAIGNDGLQFLDTLKGLLKTIDDKMLASARIQYATQKRDKATDQAFKDMDEARKALDQDMSDMNDDISTGAPTLGLKLSTTV